MSYFLMKYLRNKNGVDLFNSYSPNIETSKKIARSENIKKDVDTNYKRTRIKNYQFPLSSQPTEECHIFQNTNSLYNLMKDFSKENSKIHRTNIRRNKFLNFIIRSKDSASPFKGTSFSFLNKSIIKKKESVLDNTQEENKNEGDYHSIFNNLIIKNKMKNSFHQFNSSKSVDLSSHIKMDFKLNLNIDKCLKRIRKSKYLFNPDKDKIVFPKDSVFNFNCKKDFVFNLNKKFRNNNNISPLVLKNVGTNHFGYHKSLTMPINHKKLIMKNDYTNQIQILKNHQ